MGVAVRGGCALIRRRVEGRASCMQCSSPPSRRQTAPSPSVTIPICRRKGRASDTCRTSTPSIEWRRCSRRRTAAAGSRASSCPRRCGRRWRSSALSLHRERHPAQDPVRGLRCGRTRRRGTRWPGKTARAASRHRLRFAHLGVRVDTGNALDGRHRLLQVWFTADFWRARINSRHAMKEKKSPSRMSSGDLLAAAHERRCHPDAADERSISGGRARLRRRHLHIRAIEASRLA